MGGPDLAFPLHFLEIPATRTFSSLSRIPFLFPRKIHQKVLFPQKLINVRCRLALSIDDILNLRVFLKVAAKTK